MTLIKLLLLPFIGLAGGLAVGGGFVAFLTVLDIVPRLTQLTKTERYIYAYQFSIIVGAVCWSWLSFRNLHFQFNVSLTALHGLFAGIFVGMLAAALTEVLNVLPILAKRLNMVRQVLWLLMAMIFGKVIGSFVHWLIFVDFSK